METLARDSIRIVHVDDDDDFAELSSYELKKAGFNQPIVRCPNGLHALDYLKLAEPNSIPHVILLDLQMPGMNGLEVLHWVRERYHLRDVAVYLLTSSQDPQHKMQATAKGASEYILKSTHPELVIEKLDSLIATSNGQISPEPRAMTGNAPERPIQGLTNFSQE
jgi:CheY-like chemotaxis protein